MHTALYLIFLLQRKPGWADREVGGAELALVDVDIGAAAAEGIGTVAATGGNLPLAIMESLLSLKLADLEIDVLGGGGGGVGLGAGGIAILSYSIRLSWHLGWWVFMDLLQSEATIWWKKHSAKYDWFLMNVKVNQYRRNRLKGSMLKGKS